MMTPDSALSLAMAEYNCKQWRLLSSISDISAGALPVDDVERPGVVQALTFLAHRLAKVLCRRSHRIVAIMPLDHLNPAAGTGNTAEFIDDKLPAVARDGKEEQPLMHEIKRSVREWQPFQNIAGNEAIIFWE